MTDDTLVLNVEQLAQALVAVAGAWDFMTYDEQALMAFSLLPNNPLAHFEISTIAKDYQQALNEMRVACAGEMTRVDPLGGWTREFLRRSKVSLREADTTALKAAVTELAR